MGINLGVISNYFITIFTIKGWYDIERYDCSNIENSLNVNSEFEIITFLGAGSFGRVNQVLQRQSEENNVKL